MSDLRTYETLRKTEDVAQGEEFEWLFPSVTGTLLDESHVVRAFHRVADAAGLPRFRVYDLRHSFAFLLLPSNVPLLCVSQQLGHANAQVLARWISSGQIHRVNILDTEVTGNTGLTSQVITGHLPALFLA